jgi:DNA-binding NtrC family response regulator
MTGQEVCYKVLILGSDTAHIEYLSQTLKEAKEGKFSVESYASIPKGLERLKEGQIDLILLDMDINRKDALSDFADVASSAPKIPIVVVAKADDEKLAATAIRRGAADYLIKGRPYRSSIERYLLQAIKSKNKEIEKRV